MSRNNGHTTTRHPVHRSSAKHHGHASASEEADTGVRIQSVARRVIGTREELPKRAAVGAAVLGSAAMVTAAALEWRFLAKMAGAGFERTAEVGRALAVAAGLRRPPMFSRLLPGLGVLAGLLVGGSAAMVLSLRASSRATAEQGPRTERPTGESGQSGPWDLIDPRNADPNTDPSQPGLPHDEG